MATDIRAAAGLLRRAANAAAMAAALTISFAHGVAAQAPNADDDDIIIILPSKQNRNDNDAVTVPPPPQTHGKGSGTATVAPPTQIEGDDDEDAIIISPTRIEDDDEDAIVISPSVQVKSPEAIAAEARAAEEAAAREAEEAAARAAEEAAAAAAREAEEAAAAAARAEAEAAAAAIREAEAAAAALEAEEMTLAYNSEDFKAATSVTVTDTASRLAADPSTHTRKLPYRHSAGVRIAAGPDFFIPEAYVRYGLPRRNNSVYLAIGGGVSGGTVLSDDADIGIRQNGGEYQLACFREWHTGGKRVNFHYGPGFTAGYYTYGYDYEGDRLKSVSGFGADLGAQCGLELKLGRVIIGVDLRAAIFARAWGESAGNTYGLTYTLGGGGGFAF